MCTQLNPAYRSVMSLWGELLDTLKPAYVGARPWRYDVVRSGHGFGVVQSGSRDCGVFVCYVLHARVLGAADLPLYTQADMGTARIHLCWALLTKTLLA